MMTDGRCHGASRNARVPVTARPSEQFDGVRGAGAFVATVCPPIKTAIHYKSIAYRTLSGDIQLYIHLARCIFHVRRQEGVRVEKADNRQGTTARGPHAPIRKWRITCS